MQQMKYYSIFIYYVIAILIAIVLYIVWYIKVYQNLDLEKVSSYECGFNPLEDAFDVQIYMVALLFIIFDFLLS
jgi:NADH-quinone oxidoreductase subunit A